MLPTFLRFGYWFNIYALPFLPWVNVAILVVLSTLVLAGAVGYLTATASLTQKMDKYMRRLMRSGAVASFWIGVCGFVLYFMTWQSIPVLSMRMWWVVWLAVSAWIVSRLVRWAKKEIPAERRLHAERAAYEKWLPKPKHK